MPESLKKVLMRTLREYIIREYAVENWEDINVMIVSEINQNVEALVKVIKLQENMALNLVSESS